jgi:NTP pyrophosphatase (non-canonical NTP hydrolase)
MEKLYKIAEGYRNRFPEGAEPYQMVTRLLEECGEVAKEVNHWEDSGVKRKKHGEPKKESLADEVLHSIVALLQIAWYYGVEGEIDKIIEKKLVKMSDAGLINVDGNRIKISDIIRKLLIENGGTADVPSYNEVMKRNGSVYTVSLSNDKKELVTEALPLHNYDLSVFDIIVGFLREKGGKAKRGNGRKYKLGIGGCGYDTIVGQIGSKYWKKETGDSIFDPVHVLGAVLYWAGICNFGWGYLELTDKYKN